MSWSLGEVGALAVKAARGAGMPWGLADETGFAVKWLQARSLPGVTALCRYLSRYDGASLPQTAPDISCPILIGSAYADGAMTPDFAMPAVDSPILLLPFIAMRTGHRAATVMMGPASLIVYHNNIYGPHHETALLMDRAACQVTANDSEKRPTDEWPNTCHRVPPYMACCIDRLGQFASRTYAPSTAQSRLTGAGAGLSDND
jgi:hypothetical protein